MAGPGAIPGMVNAGVNTSVSGLITYGFEAILNNSSFNWNGWAKNIGMSMAMGAVDGFAEARNYNNLMGPRPFGEPTNINPIFGYRPSLDEKLNIVLFKHYEGLVKEFGETGVSEVIAGSRKNLKGDNNFKVSGGYLKGRPTTDYPDGVLARGGHIRGKQFALTIDGYGRFNNNKIYLSRYTIRNLYKNNINAIETLYHEFFHANDWYEGTAAWLYSINGGNVFETSELANSRMNAMLEFRAHSYNYLRNPNDYRIQMMEKYATRYWSLF